MGRVQDKVTLITGGASGVGKETARLLAAEGGSVVIADINENAGTAVAAEIGEPALFVHLDVASDQSWHAAMEAAVQRFGRLDVLVNGAAVCLSESIEDTSLELWRKVMQINADGYFLGCKHAITQMKQSGGGSIINISSTAALVGHPGMCAYSASKGAVTAMTRNIAAHCREKGYRIRCNSIHPGGILTPMTASIVAGLDPAMLRLEENPRSGFCEARDVANMVLFLASDESRFVNGAELRMDNALVVSLG